MAHVSTESIQSADVYYRDRVIGLNRTYTLGRDHLSNRIQTIYSCKLVKWIWLSFRLNWPSQISRDYAIVESINLHISRIMFCLINSCLTLHALTVWISINIPNIEHFDIDHR